MRFRFLNLASWRSISHSSGNLNKSVYKKVDKSRPAVQKLTSPVHKDKASHIRNIGIIAHIDAGKTTTTERFLFYSGIIEDLGDVDQGTTVTDYMDQERQRGITIQSAVISTRWKQHRINIIDTPGHIDFTMEVERSLWVVDGAVGILDASAGVEAQTLTVWKQADKMNLPRIIYLNKMDKPGADVEKCLDSIKQELKVTPLLTQQTVGVGRDYEGIIDLSTMNIVKWNRNGKEHDYIYTPLDKHEHPSLYETCWQQRCQLIDQLADSSPAMMDELVSVTDYADIAADRICSSLREVTCNGIAVPVLMGSSLKNCGVQPLLDAVINYLPAAADRPLVKSLQAVTDDTCAFAFKTIHEKERGAVTLVRLFSGSLKPSQSLYNTQLETSEKTSKIYSVFANQLIDVQHADAGNIVAVTGLKKTCTGDILLTSGKTLDRYEQANIALPVLDVPDPVFMCSIEPYSSSQRKFLDAALENLAKEDPSLRVSHNADTDQTVVSGMGELQLDIIKDRLIKEYNLEAFLGPLVIAYREVVKRPSPIITHEVNRVIDETAHCFSVSVSVKPGSGYSKEVEYVRGIDVDWTRLKWQHRKALNHGTRQALACGPLISYPVVDCQVLIHAFQILSPRTSLPVITAGVSEAVHLALDAAGVLLSEPVMKVQIYCDQEYVGGVITDLTQRHATIINVSQKDDRSYVLARSPVKSLLGYSTALRKLTSGRSVLLMEVEGYLTMSEMQTQQTVDEAKGLIQ